MGLPKVSLPTLMTLIHISQTLSSGCKVWRWKFHGCNFLQPMASSHTFWSHWTRLWRSYFRRRNYFDLCVLCCTPIFKSTPGRIFLWNWLIHLTHFLSTDFSWDNSRVFLLRQLRIVNYSVKSSSNNLSYENINIGVSVVFKTKHELKCQNELYLKYLFSGNTRGFFFHYWDYLTNIWRNNWQFIFDGVEGLCSRLR